MPINDEATFLRRRLVAERDELERGRLLHTLVDQWPDDPETRSLLHQLVHTDKAFLVREQAMRNLALRWKDERTCDTLKQVLLTEPEHLIANEAGTFLRGLQPDKILTWTRECLESPDPDTRLRALVALKNHSDPEALSTLRAMSTDDDSRVRAVALEELGELLEDTETEDADSYTVILDALTDPEPSVRVAAVKALGEYPAGDRPAIAGALYERVTTDKDPDVRDAAMSAMVTGPDEPRMWPDGPEAIAALRDYVAADLFAYSRRAVVKFMLGDLVDDLGIRALLSRIAEHHPDWAFRIDVIRTLASKGNGHADTKATLLRLATADPQSEVRQILLVQIVRAYKDDTATTELLTDRAEHDPDPDVREFAADLQDDPEFMLGLWD